MFFINKEAFCLQAPQIATFICMRLHLSTEPTVVQTQQTKRIKLDQKLTDAQFCPFLISKRRHIQKNIKTSVHEEFDLLQTDVFIFF